MLLKTKLYPPETPNFAIVRTRLTERLSEAADSGHHILISAGAGFGKSTLLAQWLQKNRIIPAWLSLDELDNNPHRFLKYIIGSISHRFDINCESIELLLKSASTDDIQFVFENLINLIDSIGERIYIVLDDYHLIVNQIVIQGTEFLMKHAAKSCSFIILTRFDPPISLSGFRLNNQLTELRESDLLFNDNETTELVQTVITDKEQVSEFTEILKKKAEGWIVGLRLAILAYNHNSSESDFFDRFTGSHEYVADYLMEEVLGKIDPELEEILFIASLFDRFSRPLLETVLKKKTSIHLDNIKLSGFFLIPLDDEQYWYRLHHLVSDLLKKRAWAYWGKPTIELYYLEAGHWFENHSYIEEAIQCYNFAAKTDEIIRVISMYGLRYIASGDIKTVIDWLQFLPEEKLLSTPDLCVLEGWIASINQQIDRNEYVSNIAESIYDKSHKSYIEDIEAHLALIKVNYLVQREGVKYEDIESLLLVAEQNARSTNLLLHSIIQLYRGNLYRMDGELDMALSSYRNTIIYADQINDFSLILPSTTAASEIYFIKGDFSMAEQTIMQTLEKVYENFSLIRIPKVGLLHILIAMILFEKNQIEEANKHLGKAEEISEKTNDYNAMIIFFDLKARIHLIKNEIKLAQEFLNRAKLLSEKRHLLYYSAYLVHLTFLIRKKQGNRIAIEQCLDLVEKHNNWYGFWLGQLELTRVKTLFEIDRLKEAHNEAENLRMESIKRGAGFVELQANCWLSIIYWKRGLKRNCFEVLHQALIITQETGIIRPMLDTGVEMVQIIKEYVTRNTYQDIIALDFIQNLLKEFEKEYLQTQHGLSDPLTERELEVLRLLAAGFTNQEIGNQLFLALGTVKKHSYTIYQKLGVKNRIQAVEKSRELRII